MIKVILIIGIICAVVYLVYTKVPKAKELIKDSIQAVKVKFGW